MISAFRKVAAQASMTRWRWMVQRVLSQDLGLQELDDQQLVKRSLALRYDLLSAQPASSMIIDAFALVREAARRTTGMQHYPVQLLGGLAMNEGSVAVMQTGEGKTLTATLPMYLAALSGKGAHLATANDYLAQRDAELMAPIYQKLGLSVGVVQSDTLPSLRATNYACDVTYTTAKEVGFDFLRDRLARRRTESNEGNLVGEMAAADGVQTEHSSIVQRELNFMLVDEADSILIDEARTPLIVSSLPDEVANAKLALYRWCAVNENEFEMGEHFELNPKTRQVELTAKGRQRLRQLAKPASLQRVSLLDMYDQIELALFVKLNYCRDRQYVIRDGEVVIVDEYTGRLAEGRKWKAGLHQAIEARENLEVSLETGESARITIQDLFLRYECLAGMTGTAANSAGELRKIYGLQVIDIPTNRPPQRERWSDSVHVSENAKWDAIVHEVKTLHEMGRPVLIGTRSIDKSEVLSKKLRQAGISHEVLNARNLAREAEIIESAGQVGRVTVATNMAGRGTDIKISEAAFEVGGMHVICTEIHDSARIDRQLIGRCGRQGDPGSYRQYFSLEDEILGNGLGEKRAECLKQKAAEARHLERLAERFRAAQRKIEHRHFRGRKMLLHQEKQRHEIQRQMGQDPYLDTAGA